MERVILEEQAGKESVVVSTKTRTGSRRAGVDDRAARQQEHDDLERRLAEAEADENARREAFARTAAPGASGTGAGSGHIRERSRRRPAHNPPPSPSAPPSGPAEGPVRFHADPGPLPDTAAELLAIINAPRSLAQAQAALEKIGKLYQRDVAEDMSFQSAEEFNPLVTTLGIGGNPATISAFALHVIPLRKSLGRQFGAASPAIHMLVDLTALSYWRCLQTEHAIVAHMAGALENPYFIQRAALLEKIKDLATKQLVRLLDALRAATGRSIQMDPDASAARILRFRQSSRADIDQKRFRRASAG